MRALTLAVLTVALLTACQGRVEHTDGPVAIYFPTDDSRAAAAPGEDPTVRSGTLEVVDDCLLISTGNGSSFVPLFPADDVSWDVVREELTYGGAVYQMGSQIAVLTGADPGNQTVSTDCPAGRYSAIHPLESDA